MARIITDISIHHKENPLIELTSFYSQVCTAFLVLSLIQEGYAVYGNADALGCQSQRITDDANDCMCAAGVNGVLSWIRCGARLVRDWRNTPGSAELLPYFDK
jgi:hypothetical protein